MTEIKRSYEYEDSYSMRKANQAGGGKWLRDQYKREHKHDKIAGDLYSFVKPSQDVSSQTESCIERLSKMPERFSTINKWSETFKNEDIYFLNAEKKKSFLSGVCRETCSSTRYFSSDEIAYYKS